MNTEYQSDPLGALDINSRDISNSYKETRRDIQPDLVALSFLFQMQNSNR